MSTISIQPAFHEMQQEYSALRIANRTLRVPDLIDFYDKPLNTRENYSALKIIQYDAETKTLEKGMVEAPTFIKAKSLHEAIAYQQSMRFNAPHNYWETEAHLSHLREMNWFQNQQYIKCIQMPSGVRGYIGLQKVSEMFMCNDRLECHNYTDFTGSEPPRDFLPFLEKIQCFYGAGEHPSFCVYDPRIIHEAMIEMPETDKLSFEEHKMYNYYNQNESLNLLTKDLWKLIPNRIFQHPIIESTEDTYTIFGSDKRSVYLVEDLSVKVEIDMLQSHKGFRPHFDSSFIAFSLDHKKRLQTSLRKHEPNFICKHLTKGKHDLINGFNLPQDLNLFKGGKLTTFKLQSTRNHLFLFSNDGVWLKSTETLERRGQIVKAKWYKYMTFSDLNFPPNVSVIKSTISPCQRFVLAMYEVTGVPMQFLILIDFLKRKTSVYYTNHTEGNIKSVATWIVRQDGRAEYISPTFYKQLIAHNLYPDEASLLPLSFGIEHEPPLRFTNDQLNIVMGSCFKN